MITTETIRKDLHDIKYYNSRKDLFDKVIDIVGKNTILEKINMYNRAICDASPKLYEIYVALYIRSCNQDAAAEDLGFSANYIYKMNKKIIEFFYEVLNKEAA